MHDNTLWSGPSVHFDIGLSVGGRPWGGNDTNPAYGAQMLNNTSGISKINVDTGIAVSGMTNVTVTGNTLDMTHLNVNSCPTVDVAARAGLVLWRHPGACYQHRCQYVRVPLISCPARGVA